MNLSNLNASEGIKKKIREEFRYILDLLDFDTKAHEIFRNWYIDGRLYYNKVIDQKNPEAGIQELRYIDASKMRYVRQIVKKKGDGTFLRQENVADQFQFPPIEEYFIYTDGGKENWIWNTVKQAGGVKLTRDSICYCTSGLVDRNKGATLSWMHKAIKPLNQLMMIEDSSGYLQTFKST